MVLTCTLGASVIAGIDRELAALAVHRGAGLQRRLGHHRRGPVRHGRRLAARVRSEAVEARLALAIGGQRLREREAGEAHLAAEAEIDGGVGAVPGPIDRDRARPAHAGWDDERNGEPAASVRDGRAERARADDDGGAGTRIGLPGELDGRRDRQRGAAHRARRRAERAARRESEDRSDLRLRPAARLVGRLASGPAPPARGRRSGPAPRRAPEGAQRRPAYRRDRGPRTRAGPRRPGPSPAARAPPVIAISPVGGSTSASTRASPAVSADAPRIRRRSHAPESRRDALDRRAARGELGPAVHRDELPVGRERPRREENPPRGERQREHRGHAHVESSGPHRAATKPQERERARRSRAGPPHRSRTRRVRGASAHSRRPRRRRARRRRPGRRPDPPGQAACSDPHRRAAAAVAVAVAGAPPSPGLGVPGPEPFPGSAAGSASTRTRSEAPRFPTTAASRSPSPPRATRRTSRCGFPSRRPAARRRARRRARPTPT